MRLFTVKSGRCPEFPNSGTSMLFLLGIFLFFAAMHFLFAPLQPQKDQPEPAKRYTVFVKPDTVPVPEMEDPSLFLHTPDRLGFGWFHHIQDNPELLVPVLKHRAADSLLTAGKNDFAAVAEVSFSKPSLVPVLLNRENRAVSVLSEEYPVWMLEDGTVLKTGFRMPASIQLANMLPDLPQVTTLEAAAPADKNLPWEVRIAGTSGDSRIDMLAKRHLGRLFCRESLPEDLRPAAGKRYRVVWSRIPQLQDRDFPKEADDK